MWSVIALGLVRTFGAVLSGYLINRGGLSLEDANTIAGAIGALAVAGASALDKKKRAK